MTYNDSAMHRLTMHAINHERLCDVQPGQSFNTVPSIESGRTTVTTFGPVTRRVDYFIRGAHFVDVFDAEGNCFNASAFAAVDIFH